MKKSLIVLLSMVFVLSAFAIVFADDAGVDSVKVAPEGVKVTISGDAYVRGIWQSNFDMDDREETAAITNTDDDKRYWDQRVRLKITADVGEGVELRTRLSTGDDTWNGADNTGGNTGDAGDLYVDYAYLHIPVGPVTLDLGRQKSKWGNKLLDTGNSKDRAKLSVNFGGTTVGTYVDKVTEDIEATVATTGATPTGKNTDDVDDYGIFVIHKADVFEGGVQAIIYEDNRNNEGNPSKDNNQNGTRGSAYVKVNVARVAVKAELALKNGGIYETTDKDGNINETQWGGFASVEGGPEKVTISGLVAFTRNGYVADKHFTPTVMIGTDNPTAMADFGKNPDTSAAYDGAQDSFLAVVGVDGKIMQGLSIYGKAALLVMDAYENNFASTTSVIEDSAQAFELDAGLEYQIAQNTTYNIDFGYMFPSDITAQDDEVMALAHSISISF